eukprot:scaffold10506_cov111-Isochrysis_galbana.AAC.1
MNARGREALAPVISTLARVRGCAVIYIHSDGAGPVRKLWSRSGRGSGGVAQRIMGGGVSRRLRPHNRGEGRAQALAHTGQPAAPPTATRVDSPAHVGLDHEKHILGGCLAEHARPLLRRLDRRADGPGRLGFLGGRHGGGNATVQNKSIYCVHSIVV